MVLIGVSVCRRLVEHQRQTQTANSQWPFGFVFGVQLDYSFRLINVPYDVDHPLRRIFNFFVLKVREVPEQFWNLFYVIITFAWGAF